ncbi:exonuclease SbcCD subunit D [uncultured Enterovirga sp.]|uniref:metallophosphoesterase family protein n=1 Tax=uncultured Enterovirga sp. TaxID=2026352 RepID=UPI0035CC036F
MTSFTFLHAADLHLGSPLAGLAAKDAGIAERFAAAGRKAFADLCTLAIEEQVAFVVIAGDIYDRDWADLSIGLFFAQQVSRLAKSGIPVAFVRGNHDAESVVTRSVRLPDGVLEFSSDRALTHRLDALRVALHGRSFADRAVPDESFARSYPDPVPGWFNLGILHTSCSGHAAHATYAPCSPAELVARGYDYWALGHVHDYAEISLDPHIIFPGNLQGRSVRECGPRGAVAVDVVDGRVAAIRRLVLDHARWASLEIDIEPAETERAAIDLVEAALQPHVAGLGERLLALRVALRGSTHLHNGLAGDRERIAAEIQAAAHRHHEHVWLESLRIGTRRPAARGDAERVGLLDPATLLADLDRDPAFRERAREIIAEITAKLPGGMGATDEPDLVLDLDQLCVEAEATVMSRLRGRGC